MRAFLNSEASDVLALLALVAVMSAAFTLLGAFCGAF
jgi:hypothetical protein